MSGKVPFRQLSTLAGQERSIFSTLLSGALGSPTRSALLLYRRLGRHETEERLKRAAMPLFTDPEDPTFGPAIRRLGAALRHLRLDADLPRTATEEGLRGFGGPVAVFPSEEDALFPARAVLPRAREIFPNLAVAEFLEGCRHVPSKAALD